MPPSYVTYSLSSGSSSDSEPYVPQRVPVAKKPAASRKLRQKDVVNAAVRMDAGTPPYIAAQNTNLSPIQTAQVAAVVSAGVTPAKIQQALDAGATLGEIVNAVTKPRRIRTKECKNRGSITYTFNPDTGKCERDAGQASPKKTKKKAQQVAAAASGIAAGQPLAQVALSTALPLRDVEAVSAALDAGIGTPTIVRAVEAGATTAQIAKVATPRTTKKKYTEIPPDCRHGDFYDKGGNYVCRKSKPTPCKEAGHIRDKNPPWHCKPDLSQLADRAAAAVQNLPVDASEQEVAAAVARAITPSKQRIAPLEPSPSTRRSPVVFSNASTKKKSVKSVEELAQKQERFDMFAEDKASRANEQALKKQQKEIEKARLQKQRETERLEKARVREQEQRNKREAALREKEAKINAKIQQKEAEEAAAQPLQYLLYDAAAGDMLSFENKYDLEEGSYGELTITKRDGTSKSFSVFPDEEEDDDDDDDNDESPDIAEHPDLFVGNEEAFAADEEHPDVQFGKSIKVQNDVGRIPTAKELLARGFRQDQIKAELHRLMTEQLEKKYLSGSQGKVTEYKDDIEVKPQKEYERDELLDAKFRRSDIKEELGRGHLSSWDMKRLYAELAEVERKIQKLESTKKTTAVDELFGNIEEDDEDESPLPPPPEPEPPKAKPLTFAEKRALMVKNAAPPPVVVPINNSPLTEAV